MSPRPGGLQSRPMTTTIHLSGPADVLTVLPYQLGFHPHDCLVAVSLHGHRSARMGLVQRIDLPPPEHIGDAVAAMIAPLRQDSPTAVLLIGFEERESESRAMLDEMADACRAHGVEVADRMVVRGGRRARFPQSRSSSVVRSAPCPTARRWPICWSRAGRC